MIERFIKLSFVLIIMTDEKQVYWLISDADADEIILNLTGNRSAEALHTFESGLHKTEAIPEDALENYFDELFYKGTDISVEMPKVPFRRKRGEIFGKAITVGDLVVMMFPMGSNIDALNLIEEFGV